MTNEMNNNDQKRPEDIICDCTGTTKTKIRQLIKQGNNTLGQISRKTGACTGCGSCDYDVMQFLAKEVPSE
ncbi:MAG: bacterioferritin-associated ferredoxin [Methyloprofundus sp.]|nr:MAG: bacterioferritin-associated ferredoxin [Methyloprofundus sp.]